MKEAELSANVTWTYVAIHRWLGFELDIGIVILSLCATFFCAGFKGKIESEELAFSLQIITDVTIYFSIAMRFATEMQNYMTSSQAIHMYTKLEREDALMKP